MFFVFPEQPPAESAPRYRLLMTMGWIRFCDGSFHVPSPLAFEVVQQASGYRAYLPSADSAT